MALSDYVEGKFCSMGHPALAPLGIHLAAGIHFAGRQSTTWNPSRTLVFRATGSSASNSPRRIVFAPPAALSFPPSPLALGPSDLIAESISADNRLGFLEVCDLARTRTAVNLLPSAVSNNSAVLDLEIVPERGAACREWQSARQ